jgi:hypothetical protein
MAAAATNASRSFGELKINETVRKTWPLVTTIRFVSSTVNKRPLWSQKAISKILNNAFYATLCCQIKKLPWSDPALLLLRILKVLSVGLLHAHDSIVLARGAAAHLATTH